MAALPDLITVAKFLELPEGRTTWCDSYIQSCKLLERWG